VLLLPDLLALRGRFGAAEGSMEWVTAVVIALPVILCPLIFGLLSRDPPKWGHGLAFDVVSSSTMTASFVVFYWNPGASAGVSASALGIWFIVAAFVFLFVIGMVGAWVALLIGRAQPFASEHRPATRLRPWHVGVALAAAEVVAAITAAAVLA
jgi:hypothetical protein